MLSLNQNPPILETQLELLLSALDQRLQDPAFLDPRQISEAARIQLDAIAMKWTLISADEIFGAN